MPTSGRRQVCGSPNRIQVHGVDDARVERVLDGVAPRGRTVRRSRLAADLQHDDREDAGAPLGTDADGAPVLALSVALEPEDLRRPVRVGPERTGRRGLHIGPAEVGVAGGDRDAGDRDAGDDGAADLAHRQRLLEDGEAAPRVR
jgi:hypothetical protein